MRLVRCSTAFIVLEVFSGKILNSGTKCLQETVDERIEEISAIESSNAFVNSSSNSPTLTPYVKDSVRSTEFYLNISIVNTIVTWEIWAT